jgi:predicted secreted Zn-dependent protease
VRFGVPLPYHPRDAPGGSVRSMNRRAFVTGLGGAITAGAGARFFLKYVIFFLASFISGCASMVPTPPVRLTTTKATTYYSVHGTTTSKIFDEIRLKGLREQAGEYAGEYAAGLASAKSEIRWRWRDTGALCSVGAVSITLDLVVTLPRHERPNDLSSDLQERWQRFSAAIAAHEQRHVDIFENAATAVKARIEAALKKWASCVEVEAAIRDLWKTHEVETQKTQRQFDVEDRARIDNTRKTLLDVIETKKAALTALSAELRQLHATLEDLRRRADAMRHNIDAVKVDIANADGSCLRPTDRIEALCRQYNALVASHNVLVAEHSSVLAHSNSLTGEHNLLVQSINELVETVNWVR